MNASTIQFTNGATYERYMGRWSQLAGEAFINWLAPQAGMRWLDVGCGNGAFTELIVERCAPQFIHGIDPSEAQIDYARTRLPLQLARFSKADAMALPFEAATFNVAVMPLVIFFLSKPGQGVLEMKRVVRAGGVVSAYAWDMLGGGFPYALLQTEICNMGIDIPTTPNPEASRIDVLQKLWSEAGLRDIATTEIVVQRTYTNFDDYWETVLGAPSVGPTLAAMSKSDEAALKDRLRHQLSVGIDGQIICTARANAIKGVV
jgi:ubiquinone/menaquinone biosynthesis C-methylase UbiE